MPRTLTVHLLATAALLALAHTAAAGPVPPTFVDKFPDAAGIIQPPPPTVQRVKFVCGSHEPRLVGTHFTVINVLNPHSPLPLVPLLAMTYEIIVGQPPAGGAAAVQTGPIAFSLATLAAIRIDCPAIAALLQNISPGLPPAQAQNSEGYVVLQAPCVEIGVITPNGVRYACYDPIVQTVYEHAATAPLMNKVLFTLGQTVGNFPGGVPLEVIIPAPSLGQALNLRAKIRQTLGLPPGVPINVLDVDVAAQTIDLALDVETASGRLNF